MVTLKKNTVVDVIEITVNGEEICYYEFSKTSGQICKSGSFNKAGNFEIDISNFTSGKYYLKIFWQ